MSYKYQVWALLQKQDIGLKYVLVYHGDYLIIALFNMLSCKRAGAGCVKLEWRG